MSVKIKIKCPTFQDSYEDLTDQHSEISKRLHKKSIVNISQSTLQTISGVNADEWYESRHLLMRTIADELSKETNRIRHDIEILFF